MAIDCFNVHTGQVRIGETEIPITALEDDLERYRPMIERYKNGKAPPIVDNRIVVAGDGDCEA